MKYRIVRSVAFRLVREPGAPDPVRLMDPTATASFSRHLIPDDVKEHFWIIMLNAQNRVVAFHEVSMGTLSASLVHPREVFAPALRVPGVASLILVHNHPSGDPTPSREDIRLTRQLVDAGKLLDVAVHDHLIIGDGTDRFVSLAQRGEL